MLQMDREQLEGMAAQKQEIKPEKRYIPRPKWQLVLAWIVIAVVLFAFLGTIYWMINFKL